MTIYSTSFCSRTTSSGARATVNANVPYASESGTATKWNGAAKTVSTAAPSGGANGDIWFQY